MADEFLQRYAAELSLRGFELLERLGRGSAGVVIKAEQRSVGRRLVAIKVHTSLQGADPSMEKRFRREALILGRLDHPNIPFVLTAGDLNSSGMLTPFHVMQFVDGERLSSIIERRRRLPWREAVAILVPILDALAHAAAGGIAHRDLAPDNVLIAKSGRVFLVDFSLGISTQGAKEPGLTRATESGRQLGRAQYASPEQRRDAAAASDRTDVFSAGVLLYELLSGTPELRLGDIDHSLAEVPIGVRRAMRTACNEDPLKRLSAAEFRAAIDLALGTSAPLPDAPPATVLCPKPGCSGSQRSENGFVRGPSILDRTSDLFCGGCGTRLVRRCPGCFAPLPEDLRQSFATKKRSPPGKVHCRHCGVIIFAVPSCVQCGSLLRDPDLERDTKATGCARCQGAATDVGPPPPAADDAPF